MKAGLVRHMLRADMIPHRYGRLAVDSGAAIILAGGKAVPHSTP